MITKPLMLLLTFFIMGRAFAYLGPQYNLAPPNGMSEEPNMFGSDVMFLREGDKSSGSVFIKFITNDKVIDNYSSFLLEKVHSSKSMAPFDLSKVENRTYNGHEFLYVTFLDGQSGEKVMTGLFKKDQKSYVFLLYKDHTPRFNSDKETLLKSLSSFKFH